MPIKLQTKVNRSILEQKKVVAKKKTGNQNRGKAREKWKVSVEDWLQIVFKLL